MALDEVLEVTEEQWTVEVLFSIYCISFYHLPPMTLDLVKFLSYGSGPSKALALQEVDKILLEMI